MDRLIPYIRYPHGAGGMWLSHVVWCLEHDQFLIGPATPVNFHQHLVTSSVEFGHDVVSASDLVCGGACGFHYYLNFWRKHRVTNNYLNFNQQTAYQQFCQLSDEALWIQADPAWAKSYADQVDIDFANIWQDPIQFAQQLYRTLDQLEIKYTSNDQFVESMIQHYQRTCVPVQEFLGNVDQLPWLAWCHAQALAHNTAIPFDINDSVNWDQLGEFFNDPVYVDRTLSHTVGD